MSATHEPRCEHGMPIGTAEACPYCPEPSELSATHGSAASAECEEAVIQKIRTRREQGRNKYGTTMERTDLAGWQWLQHAQEEAMDLAIYLERLLREEQADGSLTVPEAQRRRVCRICKKDDRPYPPSNPFVLNYGKEYAHEKCIKQQNDQALRGRERTNDRHVKDHRNIN